MLGVVHALKSFPDKGRAALHAPQPQHGLELDPAQVRQRNQPTRLAPLHVQNWSGSHSLAGQAPTQAANDLVGQHGQDPPRARRDLGLRPGPAHRTGLDPQPDQGHLNAKGVRNPREADPAVRGAAATPWNWSANQSAAMAAVPEVANDLGPPGPVAPRGLVFPVACASRLPLANSCSCRSQSDVPRHRPHGVQTLQANLARPARPHHRSPAPPLQRHPAGPASDRVPQEVNAGQGAPTGMTVPSWKPCGAALLRNSAKKSTSLAKTTTH